MNETTVATAELAYRTGPLQSMLFMQKVLAFMRERRYGRIINTGAHSAAIGQPGFAAFDLAEQGKQAAAMIEQSDPTGRFGTAYDDCAPVLVFLASEGARDVNGQVIGIDGGMNLIA